MDWKTDVIKYGMIVGGAGVGVYLLSRKIGSALGGPAQAASDAIGGAGEALGQAGAAAGQALGGVSETAGNYLETITACPMCNGLPNIFGTPCDKCAEKQQQDLPGESGNGGGLFDVGAGNTITSCTGPLCPQYTQQGGDIDSTKPVENVTDFWTKQWNESLFGKTFSLAGGTSTVKNGDQEQNWFKDPVPGLLETGADIQRFIFGGQTVAQILGYDDVVQKNVQQGNNFNMQTGEQAAVSGLNHDTILTTTQDIGSKANNGGSASNWATQYESILGLPAGSVQVPDYDNVVKPNSNANYPTNTVVTDTGSNLNAVNASESNFNSSSSGSSTAPGYAGGPVGQKGGGSTSSSGSSSSSSAGGSSSTSSGSSSSGGSTSSSTGSGSGGTGGSTSSAGSTTSTSGGYSGTGRKH